MRSVMLSASRYCRMASAIAPRRAGRDQQVEAGVAQRAAAGAFGVRAVGAGVGEALDSARCSASARCRPIARAQRLARREDRVGIDVAADLARDVGFARQRQRQRDEGGLERAVGEDRGERVEQAGSSPRVASPRADRGDVVDQQPRRERLHRLPAVERIAVVRGEEAQIVVADRLATSRTGAEKPRLSDGTGGSAMSVEDERFAPACAASGCRARRVAPPASLQRQVAAVAADQADRERDQHRLLGRLARRRRHASARSRAGRSWRAHRSCRMTTTSGVPACEYQSMNCVRSMPAASAKHCTNCSTVAASPSWRSK